MAAAASVPPKLQFQQSDVSNNTENIHARRGSLLMRVFQRKPLPDGPLKAIALRSEAEARAEQGSRTAAKVRMTFSLHGRP